MKKPEERNIITKCFDLEDLSFYISCKLGYDINEVYDIIRNYLGLKDNTIEGIYQLIIEDEILDYDTAYSKEELKVFETIIDDFGGHILIDELQFYDKEIM